MLGSRRGRHARTVLARAQRVGPTGLLVEEATVMQPLARHRGISVLAPARMRLADAVQGG